ncbi:cryptococcal mannosyltransferase 1-domain-containing protein [Favolaschia claudopus]|uniref:Cryptococcal mannosyltransferase 1-domain-containing protein n=1 Tax=Favolaschia claudopus TaxID=2862362 RepID=A0AAW0CID4_9AGAR
MRLPSAGNWETTGYRVHALTYRAAELLQNARYTLSRHPLPRPVVLFFQLLLWIALACWRIFVRFAHPIISISVFYQVWKACQQFWLSKFSGAWAPAFPVSRTYFVITLAAIPIWGACMAALMMTWPILRWVWGFIRARLPRGGKYEPVALDLEDLESSDDARSARRRKGRQSSSSAPYNRIKIAAYCLLCAAYLSAALFGVDMLRTYELPIDHRFKERVELANRAPKPEGYGNGEKIYIAAMFYNNGGVLPYWIKEVTKLIYYLGPDNVFVSVVESNSWDNTAALLEEFDKTLENMEVKRRILTHDSSIPRPESMATAPPRIEFLSAVRNLVMEPLVKNGGYTRVIFSNDVFIEAESIVELLDTKGGDFDMACGLDLAYWGLYDQWVIRDRLGRFASTLWPYFLEDTGFRAVMADEPAPVFACWNGIIAVRADPFLPISLRTGKQLSTSPLSRPLIPTHPSYNLYPNTTTPAETPPLRFRASGPGECFSSESFLLPYDLRRQFDMQNIYVNPRVINSYAWEWYVWFKYVTRHWAVKWWIERVENGNGVHLAKMILGDPARVWQYDGAECHPW